MSNEWQTDRTEHLEEYVLEQPDEEVLEGVKDESQVEIVELSDNEFAADQDDVKDEYENESQEEEHTNNEDFEIQEKSFAQESSRKSHMASHHSSKLSKI